MNIVGHRKIFFTVSLLLIAASVFGAAFFGLKWGIDFVGGTLWQISIAPSERSAPNASEVREFLSQQGLRDAVVYSEEAEHSLFIRTHTLSQVEHLKYLDALKGEYGGVTELRLDTMGPSVGSELRKRAIQGVIFVLLAISVYVAFAFRAVSYPVSSIKYGIITLLTLFHDVVIAFGFYVFLTRLVGIDIDVNTVVALLVVMGFSVHDTIVVFDRIRENLLFVRNRNAELGSIVNASVNQTFSRSVNTSLTLVIMLLALFFFGPSALKYFVLTILVGTVVGTYSSIFIASPLLIASHGKIAVSDKK